MSQKILFVTNGHGEIAIARRIAEDVRREGWGITEHLALVGAALGDHEFRTVGPQRDLPSGGLVAMGNVRAFARDVAAGFLPFWFAGRRFLQQARGRYAVAVAVGDAYCLLMALAASAPTVFVGTAKSAYVAPYGPFERRIIRRARRAFVRDTPTAQRLRDAGIAADAANVIADLAVSSERFPWDPAIAARLAVLPGSRQTAYANAARIGDALERIRAQREIDVAVSIAPGIDEARMLAALRAKARPWGGALGTLFNGATLAVGQAGTANEAAAAAGVPVAALANTGGAREDWYRMRQRKLLDGALAIVPADPQRAAHELAALLDDAPRRSEMAATGRARMGAPGASLAIARAIAGVVGEGG